MAGQIPNDLRDSLISAFRERICERLDVAPFLHQRSVWLASDGLELTGEPDESGVTVRTEAGEVLRIGTRSRPNGRARFLADLGAFKIGKSYGAALWASGFAAVPGAKVSLVGLEYNICEPEFSYLCEFLLSTRGMSLKAKSHVNRPRQGDMYLELQNGAVFECRSWERKESLKGKENDAYVYCEAYQLPGIECFTGFSQNLRARRGYGYFATTPDRPWVKQLHELGHGRDPEWHCTCGVTSEANPFTFDSVAKERDKLLMTKEKYQIHYEGKIGEFIGHVYNYQRGESVFDQSTHPALFRDSICDRQHLVIPPGWEVIGGADTGTFYSALIVAFDPTGKAFVIEEFPNYRYLAGDAERDEALTIPGWADRVSRSMLSFGGRPVFWADPNSQFKAELRNYGVNLIPAKAPVEARTEIAREYFEHKRIYLAPWISVLAFELENATWPDEATLAGKFARVKDRDHSLDCLEHILARRPAGRRLAKAESRTFAESVGWRKKVSEGNTHLGRW